MCLYLSVYSTNDSSAQTHACHKADMKVFLEDEWLHTGTYEEQSSVKVAMPGGGVGVVDKVNQQPVRNQVRKVYIMFTPSYD